MYLDFLGDLYHICGPLAMDMAMKYESNQDLNLNPCPMLCDM